MIDRFSASVRHIMAFLLHRRRSRAVSAGNVMTFLLNPWSVGPSGVPRVIIAANDYGWTQTRIILEDTNDLGYIYRIKSNTVEASNKTIMELGDGVVVQLSQRHACPDCGAEHEVKGGAMDTD